MSEIVTPGIINYLEGLNSHDDPVLEQMYAYAREHGQPVLDRFSARFLAVLVRALRPMLAVEIGCNIGVSALHISRAMPEGKLITFDTNPAIVEIARANFEKAGVAGRVTTRVSSGLDGLNDLPDGSVDFAFIDADKENYPNYLDALVPLLRPGGVLTADNLLWSGRVAEPDAAEASTRALREFNLRLTSNPQLEATVLPVGDGVGFAVKTD